MALRVLLADNSETIKKVIQLTLQDFALELRIVTLGVDVIEVASQFRPDIVFVDILLQKKSGYEVSRELKTHPLLKSTPVILMWSGFMEIDEAKATQSLADARLEKPFDATQLRQLVQKLVKKVETNKLGSFLDFPAAPQSTSQVKNDPLLELEKIKAESSKFESHQNKNFQISNQELEDFEMQPLNSNTDFETEETALFKVDIPDESDDLSLNVSIEKIPPVEDLSFLLPPDTAQKKTETNTITMNSQENLIKQPTPTPVSRSEIEAQVPSKELIEKIVAEKIHELVEKISWQLVPEIASQHIKKELDRLIKDNESDL